MILKDFLITLIQQAGRPLTVKELAEEVRRRKYPPRATTFPISSRFAFTTWCRRAN